MAKIIRNSRLRFKLSMLLLGLLPTLGLVMGKELPQIFFVSQGTVRTEKGEINIEKAVEKATRINGVPYTGKVFNEIKRISANSTWAFGIVSISAPSKNSSPWTRLWLAQKTKSGWVSAIEYTPAFISWVKQAPKDVLSEGEKQALGGSTFQSNGQLVASAGDVSGNFSLPWNPGMSWYMTGGPHPRAVASTRSALDFSHNSDRRVVASAPGYVYTSCGGSQIQIKHVNVDSSSTNGWQTTYYHLTNTQKFQDGAFIKRGTFIGDTGMTKGCGGSATGNHVHFSIQFNGIEQNWNGREISGWTIYNGTNSYEGRAVKGTQTKYVGGLIYNPKYSIVNVGGKCLDVKGGNVRSDGAAIGLWLCNVTDAQQWKVVGNSIRNIEGKCLDVKAGQIYTEEQPVWLFGCNGTPAQQWTVTNGEIRNVGGKCLDVKNAQIGTDGADIQLYTCNQTNAQKWSAVD